MSEPAGLDSYICTMKRTTELILFCLCAVAGIRGFGQTAKYDSTLSVGNVGYHVSCNNKNGDQNEVFIRLIGFDHTARGFDFYLRGKVTRSVIDDLNNDGYPDLILQINSGTNGEFGSIYAFCSEKNKSVIPFSLPDVILDGKLSGGYKGHDTFSLLEGSLMQKFPIYKPGDDPDKPTGGSRVIRYQVISNERGGLKFKVENSYEIK